ncbi:anthrone oxygenase family protein [Amycolatopsis rhabdoformis]|uniref:Anthrone oxygenase family protein n=1 Tax=Amycolatopsis rhabdoformis TaxID=1448059 RepID=A0ABZ1IHJ4_9PSEU|nr:anthrone oxygenase family protein [Amycolatopsis rhabdoformis]WSE33004.1 anthrone oxygenase family protein [Amycolatopsis rhabdoformis]
MSTVAGVVLVVAIVAAGLIAGLFYSYAVSVMPGLARADDQTFVTAMREINIAIVNGWFLLTFLGAPLLAAAALVLDLVAGAGGALPWLIAGFVLLLAMILISAAKNIPMNNALDRGTAPVAELRARFETSWVRWNLLRAAVSTAGFVCLLGGWLVRDAG